MTTANGTSPPRVVPNNVQAEQSLLGAMLLSADAITTAVETITSPSAFHAPAHGHIYAAITALYGQGQPVDPVTVTEHLQRAGLAETIGGMATVAGLMSSTPSTSHARRYARIVEDHHTMRRLIGAAGEIAALGYSLPDDLPAAVDQAEALIFDLRGADADALTVPLGDDISGWLTQLEDRADHGGRPEHPFGWKDLDELLGGLHPGRLTVIGARPGMGKTLWACALASNVAARDEPVLFASLEQPRKELLARFVGAHARLPYKDLMRGKIARGDWPRIFTAADTVARLPIEIHEYAAATLLTIRAAARRSTQHHGRLRLLIVDYLQLMAPHRKAENRQLEVSDIARGLKVLARELDVPVVALAQLSRSVEHRGDKRPMLADLRESGDIETSADQVVFLYRDEYYDPRTERRGEIDLTVAKNRHGALGTATLHADLAHGRFQDHTDQETL